MYGIITSVLRNLPRKTDKIKRIYDEFSFEFSKTRQTGIIPRIKSIMFFVNI